MSRSGSWMVIVSPVRMDDGRELQWHPPQPVAFSLVEAKALCDRAVPSRRRIMANLHRRPNDTYDPPNQHAALGSSGPNSAGRSRSSERRLVMRQVYTNVQTTLCTACTARAARVRDRGAEVAR